MTTIPTTYSDAVADLAQVTSTMRGAKSRIDRALGILQEAVTTLDQLDDPVPTGYADLVTYVNQQAAANPSDEAWQALKLEKDKIVTDFQAELVRATNILSAANGAA